MKQKVILSVENLSKSFPGVKALENVTIDFKEGEVHALMGENGAGKSTFMNLIFGVYSPDAGLIKVNGKEVRFSKPLDAMKCGISMIHQENSLIPHMSVMENIFVGNMPKKGVYVDKRRLRQLTEDLMHELDIKDIDPATEVIHYSVAQKQLIEIMKALSHKPKVLMMDEPTAALTTTEVENLMKLIRRLKERGTCIIYVSHRIEEVFEISDRITVLRDGEYVSTTPIGEASQDEVIRDMVGRDLSEQMSILNEYQPYYDLSKVVLEVRDLTSKGRFENVSFQLYKGEILGFSGLVGAGRTELIESIFGFEPLTSGEVYMHGEKVEIRHPKDAIAKKVGLIPEERKVKGLFPDLSVRENINVSNYKKLCGKSKLINYKKEQEAALKSVERLNIRTTSINKRIFELSGGNQQKAIIARWLNMHPDILILDEPTHGIDVGAKAEIYGLIRDLVRQGISIILISSEMTELIMLSDRIAVMHNGKLNGILEHHELDPQKIMSLAVLN